MGKTRQTGNIVSSNQITVDTTNQRVGIGTTNPTAALHVFGNSIYTGIITAQSFSGTATTAITAGYATTAGIATYATNAGVSTYATYATNAGIATYATSAGLSTYATNAGIATYATNAGIATDATKLQTPRTFEITGDIVGSPISFDGTGNVSIAATIQPNSVGLGTDTTGDYVQSITGTSNQISVSITSGESTTPILSLPSNLVIPQDATVTRDLQVNRNLNVNGNITIGGTNAFINVQQLRVSDPDLVLGFRTDAFENDVSNDNTANHGGVALASTEGTPLVQLFIAGIETTPATYKKIMWFKAGAFAGLNTDAWLSNYAFGVGTTQMPAGARFVAGNFVVGQDDITAVRNINSTGIITATSFVGPLTGNAATATYATSAGIATYATSAGLSTYATSSGIATYATSAGLSTYATNAGISTYATSSGIATYATNAGVSTYATSSGIATYATNAGIATFATSSGISTSVIDGIASVTQLNVSGISTFTSGPVFIGAATSTGTALQRLQVTGGAYVSGNLGIGTTNPTSALTVVGVVSATSFSGSGAGLTSIPAGQLTGALPAIDGSALTGIVASGGGVVIGDDGSPVGTATTIDFGANLSVSFASGIATITGSGGGGSYVALDPLEVMLFI
jgi:hypothetical protein